MNTPAAVEDNPGARSGDYSEAFAAIDEMPGDGLPANAGTNDQASSQPTDPGQPTKPAAAPDPKPTATAKPAGVTSDLDELDGRPKPADAPKPASAKPDDKAPGNLKQFRETYELTKKELADLKAANERLQKAHEEGAKKAIEEATKALKAEMDAIRKRADESETELRFTNFTRSREYRENYEKPWGEAWKAATEYANGVEVEDQATGETRKAGYQDIMALTRLSEAQAEKVAHAKFGPNAIGMLRHRARIIEAKQRMDAAVEDFKAKGAEREKAVEAERAARQQKILGEFDGRISNLETEYPVLFGKDDSDAEGNALLEKGDALIRVAFKGEGLDPSLSEEERVTAVTRVQAEVAARAKAFGRERLRSIRLSKEVQELKAKLKRIEDSEPGQGGGGETGGGAHKNPEDAIDDL